MVSDGMLLGDAEPFDALIEGCTDLRRGPICTESGWKEINRRIGSWDAFPV